MSGAHRIRLAGPWQASRTQAAGETPSESETVSLPYSASLDSPFVVLRRRFHSPTGIDDQTPIAVIIRVERARVALKLNGQELEQSNTAAKAEVGDLFQYSIDGKLRPFNELEVRIHPVAGTLNPTLHGAELQIWPTLNLGNAGV